MGNYILQVKRKDDKDDEKFEVYHPTVDLGESKVLYVVSESPGDTVKEVEDRLKQAIPEKHWKGPNLECVVVDISEFLEVVKKKAKIHYLE